MSFLGWTSDRDRLEQVELRPFRAGVAAGAELLMVAHQVVPALTGSTDISICASETGINGFVRSELGFEGLVISDALDMGALDQGPAQVIEIVAMMRAGTDLLLCMPDPALQERARISVERGHSRGLIADDTLKTAIARVERLRRSLPANEMRPELVGSSHHLELAGRLAKESITLVRNDDSLIPLQVEAGHRILSLEPEPVNVTPADTTALYPPQLATALRSRHADVTELVYPHHPEPSDISAVLSQAKVHDLTTLDGHRDARPGRSCRSRWVGRPLFTVACEHRSISPSTGPEPTCAPTVAPLFARRPDGGPVGRPSLQGPLPVTIPGLYPRGHGIET